MSLKIQAIKLAATSKLMRSIEKKEVEKRRAHLVNEYFYIGSNTHPYNMMKFYGAQAERVKARKEARAVHLARAYMKGLEYKDVEASHREPTPLVDIANLLLPYREGYEQWVQDWHNLLADIRDWSNGGIGFVSSKRPYTFVV